MANSGFDVMLQLIRISVRGICEKDGESGSFQNASRFLSFFFWTKFKNYGKMRVAFFSRSRSVTLPRSSGGTLDRRRQNNKNHIAKQKLRKNACSIFLEVKVRDLAAVQRRPAGRAEHEIKKNKNA